MPRTDRQISESKAVTENALRWCNNILVEINQNHVGPCFPKTRDVLMQIIRLNAEARETLLRESKAYERSKKD